MIALTGRRSVAGLTARLLAVINVFVLIGAVACLVSLVALVAAPDLLMGAGGLVPGDGAALGWTMAGGFLACLFTWLTLLGLVRVLRAVNAGRAFEPANVGRLRLMGVALAGLQLSTMAMGALGPVEDGGTRVSVNLGAWLGVLVVFILAEVFRQGSDMRDENQNTI